MAQKRRKAPVSRKRRSWTVPRLLLILGYGIIFAFLGVIFLMRQELFRVGIFGDKPVVRAPAPTPASPRGATESQGSTPASPQVAKEMQRQAPAPSSSNSPPSPHSEIYPEEKQALDDILRSKR
jgi:hypothetical protein